MFVHQYLVVEGNIGSGKTSLVDLISRQFNLKTIYERFEENPFLPLFYKEPDRYSFQVELAFLADRYKQLQEEVTNINIFKPKVISDYILSKSLVFAEITLTTDEFKLYKNLFNIVYQQLPKPDLLVYLYSPSERLLDNIKKRNRPYEQEIDVLYLEKIQTSYIEHLKQQINLPVLLIDTSNLDFVNKGRDYALLIEAVNITYPPGINRIEL